MNNDNTAKSCTSIFTKAARSEIAMMRVCYELKAINSTACTLQIMENQATAK